MSDRPLTQQRLASDLANLIDNINEEAVIPFLSAFWKTMAREWRGIDVFRYILLLFSSIQRKGKTRISSNDLAE